MDNLEFAQKLEIRTQNFFYKIVKVCKKVPRNPVNDEITSQLTGAGGSTASNYIEANEALSKKDFFFRIRICRKESKEARFWLKALLLANPNLKNGIEPLIQEATEFLLIFSKIIETHKKSKIVTK